VILAVPAAVPRENYQAKISGPMVDRFDLIIEVPEISAGVLLDQGRESQAKLLLHELPPRASSDRCAEKIKWRMR